MSNSNLQNEESINNEFVLDNDDADVPNVDVASKKTKEKAKGGTHLGEEVLVGKKDSRDLETETIRTMARTTRRKIQNPKTKR